jgi:hypothetical protein
MWSSTLPRSPRTMRTTSTLVSSSVCGMKSISTASPLLVAKRVSRTAVPE